jgi:hypothetical protein
MPLEAQIDKSEMFFDFHWNVGENDDGTAEDILALNQCEIRNPRHFGIEAAAWDDALLESFMEVFRHCAEKKIVWKDFDLLSLDSADHPFLWRLLRLVNSLGLFEEMVLAFFASTWGLDESEEECVLSGIDLNKRLEILDIDVCVGAIFVGDFHALNRLLQTTACLKELKFGGMVNINDDLFCQGLAANTTLERLSLDCTSCDALDISTANIFSTLATHPSLQELTVASSNHFGDLSSRALQILLTSSSSLHSLTLKSANASGKLRGMEHILQGLKHNRSLRVLETFNALYGDLLLSRFFRLLPECPSLERISILETAITREDLESVKTMNRLRKPIELKLARHTINYLSTTVGEMIQCHPELRLDTGGNQFGESGRELKHMCDLNWHGRYLLDRGNIPYCLWALVFAKASSKPSVVYEFLKGPAFAARNDWV